LNNHPVFQFDNANLRGGPSICQQSFSKGYGPGKHSQYKEMSHSQPAGRTDIKNIVSSVMPIQHIDQE